MFSLPRDVCVTALARALSHDSRALVHGPVRMRREWLDTFDWRLFDAGLVLEYQHDAGGGRLLLFAARREPLELNAPDRPRFVSDLPTAVLRRRLARVMDVRALLPRSRAAGAMHELRLLDARGKTVARVQIWRPARRAPCFVRVLGLAGYSGPAAEASRRLAEFPGAGRLEADPLLATATGLVTPPGEHPGWSAPPLDPAMRTDAAMLAVMSHYRDVMDLNIQGMVDDVDPEFLHDFRVGLRRSRALLRRVQGVFAPRRLQPFSDELRRLGGVTGPPRDADVHALEFPGYIAALAAQDADAMGPLMARVAEERATAHRELVRDLQSARFRRRWAAWSRFLSAQPPRVSRQPLAAQPIGATVVAVVGKAARRVRKEGLQIEAKSPPGAYHDLRKSCKNLRYLIDAFRDCLPIKNLDKAVRLLKKLQDVLGEHQDLDVHAAAISRLYRELAERGELPGSTHLAVQRLVDEMSGRAARARGHFGHEFKAFMAVGLDRQLRGGRR